MAFRDLRDFIDLLERTGELKRIAVPVDPILEISEICDRVVKEQGPALLFEKPLGSQMPVLINAFGTKKRMEMALGVENLDEIADRIRKLIKPKVPKGFMAALSMLPELKELLDFPPRVVGNGPVREVVKKDGFSLNDLPVLKCWPEDGGRFITFPLVITKNPKTGERNVGMYRMQVIDDRSTFMHWQKHKDGRYQYEEFARESRGADASRRPREVPDEGGGGPALGLESEPTSEAPRAVKDRKPLTQSLGAAAPGKRFPVAVALGGDPATMYAATAPLPEGIDEFLFAGFLRKQPVELVKCETVDLEVPAHAEMVLEGYVDPSEPLGVEGPFGDHTGYYSLADKFPVFHITCMTQRRNPIYPTIIVGKPIQEDYWLGKATERIFLPLLQMMIPEMIDYNMPPEGIFHNMVIVSIKKRYAGQGKKVASGLWGMGQMMFAKTIVVVDEDVNVHDLSEVAWKALNHIDPKRDFMFAEGPLDELNYASSQPCYGSKVCIDATRKLPEEGFTREVPPEIFMTPEIQSLVDRRWKEYGL